MAFGWGVADGVTEALQTCGPGATPPTIACFKGIAGSGPGQLASPNQLAVDNGISSGSQHDLYVFETKNARVQKFSPEGELLASPIGGGECPIGSSAEPNLAIGPAGVLYIAESAGVGGGLFKTQVEKLGPSGICLPAVALPETHRAKAIAVDSVGSAYVAFTAVGGFRKYDSTGNELYSRDLGTETNALTTDSADNIFAAQRENHGTASYQVITEYNMGGTGIRRFGYGQLQSAPADIAAYHSASGDVLASQGSAIEYLSSFPPGGPIVAPGGLKAPAIGNTWATVAAEINPEGKATSYHFDYVDQENFEKQGGFTGPATKSTPATSMGDEGFELKEAEAEVGCKTPLVELAEGKCLTPETTYHFRVVSSNSDGPGKGEEIGSEFTTKPALEIVSTFATEVGTDSARLSAEVNPLGLPTTSYFEYVTDSQFNASGFAEANKVPNVDAEPPEGELDFGSGLSPVTRSITLDSLHPGTAYHYRVVANDPLIEPVEGPGRVITTFAPSSTPSCAANEAFRSGPSALLPDCRAYELVSPLDKSNGDVLALEEPTTHLPATLDQSSVEGTKLAYGSYRPFGDAESGATTSQYIAVRNPESGWLSHGISPPRTRLDIEAISSLDTEFKVFSPDLCNGWLRTVAEKPLSESAVSKFANIYRRHDEVCGEKSYEAITTIEPPHRIPIDYNPLELQGVSADGTAAIYAAPDNLSPEAPKLPGKGFSEGGFVQEAQQLYERSGGRLHFVCILPGEVASEKPCQAGGPGEGLSRTATLDNALSADGSRIFWTSYKAGGTAGPGPIYVRINNAETIAVSKVAEEETGVSSSQYWTAAQNGSKAIFTTGENLYEFDVESKATTLIAHKVIGIMGASEDASYIYLASQEVLTGPNAEGKSPVAGKVNLYLDHEGSMRFVMTFASSDISLFIAPISAAPFRRTSRVAPDGRHAAFMSAASPSGYDNVDAKSGRADAEVYLYDAMENEGAGRLVCASCNPTGARPAGSNLEDGLGEYWAAAQLPIWENSLYAARSLSDDGTRLFFESTDSLVPRDTNGIGDVYEWEATGIGGCDEEDSTFAPSSSGCIDLISSGQSGRASEFTDASPSGDDVFFATLESLLPQDYGLVDIYDAKVSGGFPPPPPLPVECESETCQHPAPAPTKPGFSSSGYEGPGDQEEVSAKKPRCSKGKVRRKGRCVKKPQKQEAKHKRHTKPNENRRTAR